MKSSKWSKGFLLLVLAWSLIRKDSLLRSCKPTGWNLRRRDACLNIAH